MEQKLEAKLKEQKEQLQEKLTDLENRIMNALPFEDF